MISSWTYTSGKGKTNLSPRVDLFLVPDAGNVLVAARPCGNESRFGDQEGTRCACPLLVVGLDQVKCGHMSVLRGPETRQRCQCDAMLEGDIADFDGLEEFRSRCHCEREVRCRDVGMYRVTQ